jgi:hypothetical protein
MEEMEEMDDGRDGERHDMRIDDMWMRWKDVIEVGRLEKGKKEIVDDGLQGDCREPQKEFRDVWMWLVKKQWYHSDYKYWT